jgi:hypothetical protein
MATSVAGPLTEMCSTPTYVAPEVLSRSGYTYQERVRLASSAVSERDDLQCPGSSFPRKGEGNASRTRIILSILWRAHLR